MDGETHINIYSKGKTEVGRWLSNFSYSPIQTEHGHFNSIEGYWYYLSTLNEELRTLSGYAAKKAGKESKKIQTLTDEEFKKYICKAIDVKIKTRPYWIAKQVTIPLQHYYEYGGKRVEAGYEWITEHIQMRVNQLRQYYKL